MKKMVVRSLTVTLFFFGLGLFQESAFAQKLSTSVTKQFVVSEDNAMVDIKSGSVTYEFYSRRTAFSEWTLEKTATIPEPTDKSTPVDITLNKADSYEIKLVLTTSCDACATVTFK